MPTEKNVVFSFFSFHVCVCVSTIRYTHTRRRAKSHCNILIRDRDAMRRKSRGRTTWTRRVRCAIEKAWKGKFRAQHTNSHSQPQPQTRTQNALIKKTNETVLFSLFIAFILHNVASAQLHTLLYSTTTTINNKLEIHWRRRPRRRRRRRSRNVLINNKKCTKQYCIRILFHFSASISAHNPTMGNNKNKLLWLFDNNNKWSSKKRVEINWLSQ